MTYYVYNGTCPNKSAYDLYIEYIKVADGYCHDELQEESDGTWTIFTRLDWHDWIDYPYELRFQKFDKDGVSKIWKSEFMTSKEYLERLSNKENHLSLAASDSDAEEWSDHGGEEYDDLYCYEKLN